VYLTFFQGPAAAKVILQIEVQTPILKKVKKQLFFHFFSNFGVKKFRENIMKSFQKFSSV